MATVGWMHQCRPKRANPGGDRWLPDQTDCIFCGEKAPREKDDMSKDTQHTDGYTGHLTVEQRARVEALKVARETLIGRGTLGSGPSAGPNRVDLIAVAKYVVGGD